jgi:ADP-ribosylglycohydrolase
LNKSERFKGCLLGLAAGDALGTSLEFKPPGSFDPIQDVIGGGPFRLKPGEWTDDTSMALCLAESLIERQGFDPTDQMERYLRWYRQGHLSSNGRCFDIGNTVRQALESFERSREPYSGSSDPFSAGNGSLMRLAPVAMFYASQPELAIQRCADTSRTTHAAPAAIDACRYFGGLLVGALNGTRKGDLLDRNYTPANGYWDSHPLVPEIEAIAEGGFKNKQPPEIKGSGYVVRSLEAALWAFYHSDEFRSGCLLAANLGDDADTTAAIYGQLAGAYYGVESIPKTWRDKLSLRRLIKDYALRLCELSQR